MLTEKDRLSRSGVGTVVFSLGLVLAASGFVQAQTVPVGNYVAPGKANSDQTYHPTVARRSLHGTEAAELPVGSVLFSGDTVYIRWMEAKLRLCPDGDKIYGRPDKDETAVLIADCYERNEEVPRPDSINLYIHTSWSPLSFRKAYEAATADTQTKVGYPPPPEAKKHRLYLIGSDDRMSNVAAMFGVSADAIELQNSGGGDWGYNDGDLIKIPLVPHKLNWPTVGRLNPERNDALEFENIHGAAVWGTGIGELTVKQEEDNRFSVAIDHHNGFVSKILGLTNLQKQTGALVDANDLLGEVAGDRLEFQVLKNGEKINPLEILAIHGEPAKIGNVP